MKKNVIISGYIIVIPPELKKLNAKKARMLRAEPAPEGTEGGRFKPIQDSP